ncbi:UNVERIFIED_CONTAM: L-cystine transport system permease protein [Brevibacillus sp. OAP136]
MGKAFDITLIVAFLPKLLAFLHVTLFVLALSLLFGLLIGVVLALPRLYKVPIISQLAALYVSFVRGTPILIQLFLVYYGLPALLQTVHLDISRVNPIFFVIVTYSFSSAAFISETIRGAVNSVDRGQVEAAYAIGLTGPQTFFRIVVPQALMIAFPNFTNTIIGFLKDTSLTFSIGVMDMMGRGQALISATAHSLEVNIALAIIYYAVVIILEKLFVKTEGRLQRHERRLVGA